MLGGKFHSELLAYPVQNKPDGGFEGVEVGICFGAQPLVLHFTPQGLDFVEVGAVGGEVKDVDVLVFPRL